MSELKVNKVTPRSGTTVTLGDSGDTITIPSGATITNSGTATGFGGTNTPAFFATLSADQTVSDNVFTKAQINTEVLDTDGCYDNTTNYRFTPTVAGKYYVFGVVIGDGANSTLVSTESAIYKNGSIYLVNFAIHANNNGATGGPYVTGIVDMNGTTDYLELFGRTDLSSGTPVFFGNNKETAFGAYKIIGA